jgi:hypothetical protein
MAMQKPFFKSRTNWSGIIVVVLGILQLLVTLLSAQGGRKKMLALAIATIVFGAAMIIFRTWFADKPVKK